MEPDPLHRRRPRYRGRAPARCGRVVSQSGRRGSWWSPDPAGRPVGQLHRALPAGLRLGGGDAQTGPWLHRVAAFVVPFEATDDVAEMQRIVSPVGCDRLLVDGDPGRAIPVLERHVDMSGWLDSARDDVAMGRDGDDLTVFEEADGPAALVDESV